VRLVNLITKNTVSYLEKLGLPFLERKILLNYLRRVDHLVEEELGKKLFSDSNVYSEAFDKNIFIENMLEALASNKNIQTENEEGLINQYVDLKAKLDEMKAHYAVLDEKAHRNVKIKMSLGILALLGHGAFVGVGTYVVYSWDIMEPMVYFITLAASIGLSVQFFKTFDDYSNMGIFEYMKERELKKLSQKAGFPRDEMLDLVNTVDALEQKIKANILIHL